MANPVQRRRGVSAPSRPKAERSYDGGRGPASSHASAVRFGLLGFQFQAQAVIGQAVAVFHHGAGAPPLQCKHYGLRGM